MMQLNAVKLCQLRPFETINVGA